MGKLRQHHRQLLGLEGPTPPAPSNFDMNMVIILAALLCALIFALGLNSIVRCALRCGRRLSSLELQENTAAAARTTVAAGRRGLKRSALRQIPVAVYGEGGVRVVSTDCTICLGEFVGGEKVRVLPRCNHGFHVGCIDTWLVSHSSCPTCRLSMADAGSAVGLAAAAAAGASVGGDEAHGSATVGGDDGGGG